MMQQQQVLPVQTALVLMPPGQHQLQLLRWVMWMVSTSPSHPLMGLQQMHLLLLPLLLRFLSRVPDTQQQAAVTQMVVTPAAAAQGVTTQKAVAGVTLMTSTPPPLLLLLLLLPANSHQRPAAATMAAVAQVAPAARTQRLVPTAPSLSRRVFHSLKQQQQPAVQHHQMHLATAAPAAVAAALARTTAAKAAPLKRGAAVRVKVRVSSHHKLLLLVVPLPALLLVAAAPVGMGMTHHLGLRSSRTEVWVLRLPVLQQQPAVAAATASVAAAVTSPERTHLRRVARRQSPLQPLLPLTRTPTPMNQGTAAAVTVMLTAAVRMVPHPLTVEGQAAVMGAGTSRHLLLQHWQCLLPL
jgi:hypothetical protein